MSDTIREEFEAWFESLNHSKPEKGFSQGGHYYLHQRVEDAWCAWKAALSQQPAPAAVPDGWKLVPVKPTIEMVEAGYEASVGQPDRSGHARAIEMFDAMLAASPAAPAPAAQEPIKLSDDTREFLQEWIGSALEDDDHDFANQLVVLLGPIYTATPAAEQLQAMRALLKRMFVAFDTDGANPDPIMDELRALLAKEGV